MNYAQAMAYCANHGEVAWFKILHELPALPAYPKHMHFRGTCTVCGATLNTFSTYEMK